MDRGSRPPPIGATESPDQITPFPPYYDLLPAGSNMNTAARHFDLTNVPKYWNPPLTCYYWHSYGYCNKTDVDCLYAHYNTGTVASAPFAMAAGYAGRTTTKRPNEQLAKQRELKDREAGLVAREKQLLDKEAWLAGKAAEVHSRYAFGEAKQASDKVVREIYEVIHDTKTALAQALDLLNNRSDKPKIATTAIIADHAAGDIAKAIVRLQRAEVKAERHFGKLDESVDITFHAGQS